jgi:4-diphosphocytidyl-2-C-methyl-D-erythritol kinase
MNDRRELLTPAKINLFLRITGRRANGYHELDSVFVPVSLFDRVTITASPASETSVELRCNWPDLPRGADNLAVRAALRFIDNYGLKLRLLIDLSKQIPAGAGLGGGSSDAAAVLRILADMTGHAVRELADLALGLGADVPFFLDPRPARVGGIGERIEPLNHQFPMNLVIAVPPVVVSTPAVFAALKQQDWSGPAPRGTAEALAGGAITLALLRNDLERAAVELHPVIGQVKFALERLGSYGAAMSGSGGAVFGLFADRAAAALAASRIGAMVAGVRAHAATTAVVPPVNRLMR